MALGFAGDQHVKRENAVGNITVLNKSTCGFFSGTAYAGVDKLCEVTRWTGLLGISSVIRVNIDLRQRAVELNRNLEKSRSRLLRLIIVEGQFLTLVM